MKQTIEIGFSPCPNDTFIFDALINGRIDTGNLSFRPVLEDVETLNNMAKEGRLPITKLSYGVLGEVNESYHLLSSGSALGKGVGPLMVSLEEHFDGDMANIPVAIPGEHTTAHMLFSLAYPGARNKHFMRYDAIEEFVLSGKGLGVIIHENRFTYKEKGLHKISDLGDYWEKETGLPIPLGGIVIRNDFAHLGGEINLLIRKSLDYAYSVYPSLGAFITSNAKEMNEEVMRQHIQLYVNDYTYDLGTDGKEAVLKFMSVYGAIHGKPGPQVRFI